MTSGPQLGRCFISCSRPFNLKKKNICLKLKLTYRFERLVIIWNVGVFLICSGQIFNKYHAISNIAFWLHSKPDISIAFHLLCAHLVIGEYSGTCRKNRIISENVLNIGYLNSASTMLFVVLHKRSCAVLMVVRIRDWFL